MHIEKFSFRSLFSGVLPLFMLAHFAHHLMTALPPPILPFIRNEFKLDYTQSAWVLFAFTFTNGFSQIPAGWLADRMGPRILITIGICGVALAGILIGLSQTYIMIIVFLVLMGLLCGGYHPSAAPTVSLLVEPEIRGRALGFHEIGAGISFFVVPMVAAAIAAVWGWRMSFIGLAVPALIYGLVFYEILRRQAGIGKARQVETSYGDETSFSDPSRVRHLVIFLIMAVAAGAFMFTPLSFVPLYMVDEFGVSEQMAGSFLSIRYSAGLWASIMGGYLSDRLGKVPVMLVANLMAAVGVYLLTQVPYGVGFGALLLIMGVCDFVRMPVAEAYIMSKATERNRSTIYGMYYFSMTETGAVLAPAVGALIDHIGFYYTFTIASVTAIAFTLICSVFLLGTKD